MGVVDNSDTNILQGNFSDELKSRYLTYAMSTIMARALPDVRDGLKPVHRRVLFAMHMMHLNPEKGYKKCARVVGDVIGKYHPHGDQSVYDAMVRLSQDFALRYPLVDGQGNFGSIDGDGAAAMRYTEAKMTKVAAWIMHDINNGTVDFKDNYDESDSEPDVMPAGFPNLLANGGSGIAVGLSTSIPPHNITELCSGFVALLKNPSMRDETMLNHVKGPDFPLGGILIEPKENIAKAYATGRGGFRLRSRWEKEETGKGQYNIVVTEIPYQVQKSRIIEKIADLINERRVPWLVDIRDESDENIRIVLEPKNRNVDAEALMESLFRLSDLENKISINMNVITSAGMPQCLSLKEAMQEYLDHRRNVLIRKSTWRSQKIHERLHILDAYSIAFLNIDEVIEIIKNNDNPAEIMMQRFNIDTIQANAILDMRLRRLRKLEEIEIRKEHDELSEELKGLQAILGNPELQTETLINQIKLVKKEFGDERRTSIEDAPNVVEVPVEAQIEKEPVTILLSKQGWVRAMKGHMTEGQEAKYKDGDSEAYRIPAQTIDNVMFLGSSGKIFTIQAAKLPAGRGFGEPLSLMVDIKPNEEIVAMFLLTSDKYLIASKGGYGFVAEAESLKSQTKSGKQILNPGKADKAMYCIPVEGDSIAAVNSENRLLIFPVYQVSVLGRGKGVRLINVKGGFMKELCVFHTPAGLGFRNKMTKDRVIQDLDIWRGKRAHVGKLPPHGFTKEVFLFAPELPEGVPPLPTPEEQSINELVENASQVEASKASLDDLINIASTNLVSPASEKEVKVDDSLDLFDKD